MYPVKKCRPGGVWSWGRATVKFYVLAPPGDDVDAGTVAVARTTLADSSGGPAPASTVDDEVGFAILHRYYTLHGTEHLLQACTWRAVDELWETLWTYAGGTFVLEDHPGPHRPTYCVWEMGVVAHETRAWRRVLDNGSTPAAIQDYLRDTLDDVV